jgi:DNA-binding transcriptional regulator of glucitol operon
MLFWLFSGESGSTGTSAAREGLISWTSVNSGLQRARAKGKIILWSQDLSPRLAQESISFVLIYDRGKIERKPCRERSPVAFAPQRRSGGDQMARNISRPELSSEEEKGRKSLFHVIVAMLEAVNLARA